MKQVGIYEAKTHLPQLVDEVERGESVTITRHGKPVARLVPLTTPRMTVKEAIEATLAVGKEHPLGDGLTIRELIEEGRRF